MAADWHRLTKALSEVAGGSITYTWTELEELVGHMPRSSIDHSAWWGGDRPHTRAWRQAGFRVERREPGVCVRFVREGSPSSGAKPAEGQSADQSAATSVGKTVLDAAPDLLLVTCVKTKADTPRAAKDLYTSSTLIKSRRYAESSGLPWFILSAEHGLVQPDEWLAPYERYLPDTSQHYQRAWGAWVLARLELLVGSLQGRVVEIHASRAYVDVVRPALEQAGAVVLEPLRGLPQGRRSQWYDEQLGRDAGTRLPESNATVAIEPLVEALLDSNAAIRPADLLARGRVGVDVPGLYSWWIDERGAQELSEVLDAPIEAGLLYAGLAGATRWPSGRRSTNTLWLRIVTMHLGGRHEFSTFRRSLGALRTATTGDPVDEADLTRWMHDHLRVVLVPFPDADQLGAVESEVLTVLDPPLNLKGVRATPLRGRLKELRRDLKSR